MAATNHSPFTMDAARRLLAERYDVRVSEFAELGGGDWSRAFAFRVEGRELVLRLGRHVEDFVRDRKAMAFDSPALPVPPVLEIGEEGDLCYAVSERRFGVFLEALDEAGWRRILPALLRGLDALPEVDPPGVGADWASEDSAAVSWRDWLLRSLEDRPGERVSGWREKIRQSPDAEEVFTAGFRVLTALLPYCPEERHIAHRDLLNRNVLVSPDAGRLEAVFDWGCSVAGDFLYEIAWFTFWAPWYPALLALDLRRAVREHYRSIGLEVQDFDRRLACYELQIGLEHIAYATFTDRFEDRQAVTQRTRRVLAELRA